MHRPCAALAVTITVLCGSLIAACGGEATKDLKTFNAPGYSVLMPGTPERSVDTVQTAAGPVKVVAFVSDSDERAFAVASTKLPKGIKGDLDGAVKGAASNIGGQAREVKRTTYQGFPARDSRVTGAEDSDGNAGTVFARFILADDRLFQLQFVTKGADVKTPDGDYGRFVASLKIK